MHNFTVFKNSSYYFIRAITLLNYYVAKSSLQEIGLNK